MKLPARIANPVLAVLLQHSGYGSLDEFATAVNKVGAEKFRLKLSHDHTAVKRWLAGGRCQQAGVVAKALSLAWGVEIPAAVILPQQREGAQAASPHLRPAIAERTLDELATFIGSDMLTRRRALTAAIQITMGTAFTGPLLRWLPLPTTGLPERAEPARSRLTMGAVDGIEKATARFYADDAADGGGLSREAAVGQLKHGVDLLRDASYPQAVGDRMFLAVANLADLVGWMSHDVGMEGPAQRYFTLGLHAARESRDRRAPVMRANILADMARQMDALQDHRSGLECVDAAIAQLPRGRHQGAAATLWNLRARMLAPLGPGSIPETRHAIGLAEDLLAAGDNTDPLSLYAGPAELAGNAALAWQSAAENVPDLAEAAAAAAQFALDHRPAGFSRSRAFDQISLACARFTLREPDQGADDGHAALDLADAVAASTRVHTRLRGLLSRSAPYTDLPKVRDFRERLIAALAQTDA